MKKSLLALAAMGAFASAAQAQSSVSVYGIYDGGYSVSKTDMSTAAGVKSGTQAGGFSGGESASSRIGFRGVEDLGGGLSANFNLELGITAGTGQVSTTPAAATSTSNTTLATGANQGSETGVRTSIVGIGSKQFGSLAVGRQLTGMHSILAGDVWGGNNMAGDITYSDVSSNTSGAGTTATARINSVMTRSSNMLTYTSPTVMGANLRADYGNTVATSANQPGIQYAMKGIYAGYKYGPVTAKIGRVEAVSNEALTATAAYAGSKTVVTGGNIMYQDKGLTVQYTNGRNLTETYTAAGGYVQGSAVKANKISASYQIGAVMPFVQYGQGVSEGVRTAANTATDDKAFQLGAEYALSKRSSLYAAYGSHKKALKTNSSASTEITDMAVGLRHTF